ncbi:MAG: LysE/ArgO family amino acid transporter [Brachymonas sp.]|nr:LysE/ArgO family amino acid transporter [Brachymonas sp.]
MHPAQVVLTGFVTCISLIFAIGAQNAFVLRQGVKGEHVFWVCVTCAGLDAVLMALGVGGFHILVARWPWIIPLARYGGAAFLLWYGWRNAVSAFKGTGALQADNSNGRQTLSKTVLTCLMISLLNPHVYLDTVVLIGGLSTRYVPQNWYFWLGTSLGSFVFFFSLGYGARLLRPLLATPKAWRVLDGLIAITMWVIAGSLLWSGV